MSESGDSSRTVGRYTITREIGRGGMATVYLARQQGLERDVALKQLAAFHAADASFSERFLRESQMAGGLSHPNIVTVYDFFEEAGAPYIAMEYLERGSLRPWIHTFDLAVAAGVITDVLAGLAHAEERRIVHRDLKPENLMLTGQGRIKITDFGIAKAYDQAAARPNLTATGMTMGTPSYMAPEQALGKEVGPWTDLYSLGVIGYEMLVGQVPFADSDTPVAILMRQVNESIPAPRSVNPDIDPQIEAWLERMLEKDPERRYRSATEAADDLDEIVTDLLGPRWRRGSGVTTYAVTEPKAPAGGETLPPKTAAAPEGHDDEFVTYGAHPAAPLPPPIETAPPDPAAGEPPAPTAPAAPAAEPPAQAPAGEGEFVTFMPSAPPTPPPPEAPAPAAPAPEPEPPAAEPIPSAPVAAPPPPEPVTASGAVFETTAPLTPAPQTVPSGTFDWPTVARGKSRRRPWLVLAAAAAIAAVAAGALLLTRGGSSGRSGATTTTPPPAPATWTHATFPASPQRQVINGLAGGAHMFVAVGSIKTGQGRRAAVWTSTDGTTWAAATPPGADAVKGHQSLGGVVVDGSTIIVTGRSPTASSKDNAVVWISSDAGSSWTDVSPPGSTAFSAIHNVVKTADGFVGVGEWNKDAAAWRSSDGTTWKRQCPNRMPDCAQPLQQNLTGAVVAGTSVIAVGNDNGHPAVWSESANGLLRLWRGPGPGDMVTVARLRSGGLVAVGYTRHTSGSAPAAWWSGDGGKHWSQPVELAPGAVNTLAYGVAATVDGAVAVGVVAAPGGGRVAAIWTSPDGKTWKVVPAPTFAPNGESLLSSVAASGKLLVAAGSEGADADQRAAAWRLAG
jgi:Protein kinase domain